MQTPRPRGSRRSAIALLALVTVIATCSAAFIPSPQRVAQARSAEALGDVVILAGPGGQYGILTVAPTGTVMDIQGDPVDGFYPVHFEGIDGWAAEGLLAVGGGGGGGGKGDNGGNANNGGNGGNRESGNGGTSTVTADPVFVDGGAPVDPAASAPADAPVSGGTYGPGGGGYSEEQIVGIIYEAADAYGQPREDMLRVARCESGLNPQAVGGGGAYHGLFQFVPATFSGTPYGEYDIYDPWANSNAAAWMWSEGKKGEWVCQ
jgi:hypothetical protein